MPSERRCLRLCLETNMNAATAVSFPNLRRLLRFASDEAGEAHDSFLLRGGTTVAIRAVRPDDEALMQALVRGLSTASRYRRFFYPLHELPPEMLDLFTRAQPTAAMTLMAVVRDKGERGDEIAVGMAQYVAAPFPERGDFAVVVADAWQRAGIARRLLRNLICIARAAGIERLEGDVLSENEPMRQLLSEMEFSFGRHPDGAYLVKASKALSPPPWKCSSLTALAMHA
jgi:acetyltransferase